MTRFVSRAWCGLALLVGLLVGSPASAQSLNLATLNARHLGWVGPNGKTQQLHQVIQASDVTLLQEVMTPNHQIWGGVVPSNYLFEVSNRLRGKGWYKETYLFVYNPKVVTNNGAIDYPDQYQRFSRAPYAMRVTANGKPLWLVNFHAIWGKTRQGRRDEATAMTGVVDFLKRSTSPPVDRIVIGGDWNLPSNDAGFNSLRNNNYNYQIGPSTLTTLNSRGGFSSSYDHFAWSPSVRATVQPQVSKVGISFQNWSTYVSDHLPVVMSVQ